MKTLRLAADLSFPLDAITQTFLIVGKRGSGKSNTAARFVEQLYRAKLPFVVLDPVDTWYGLKAGVDGGAGLSVYVFGGRHQDLPLEVGSGALIADVLCEHRLSMVLSVKHLSGRERSAFMVAFAQTLFQKWQGGPLHVVLEEAHELAPQMAGGRSGSNADNEAAMLGAFKRLWKLGRASGIGGTAVTQRPASLSKDITTQSEILIAHRTIGPQDVKAIGEWVKYHGQHEDILKDLPSLPTGEAFVWAPEFPEGQPVGLTRATILRRDTFDSASTPKVGETRVEPKELASVDLERLRSKMAATIEKAKADDPRELRKQIADKDKRIKELEGVSDGTHIMRGERHVEKPALTEKDREILQTLSDRLHALKIFLGTEAEAIIENVRVKVASAINTATGDMLSLLGQTTEEKVRRFHSLGLDRVLDKLSHIQPPTTQTAPRSPQVGRVAPPVPATSRRPAGLVSDGDASIGKCERAILSVLAQHPDGCNKSKLALLAGYSYSGGFRNALSALRGAGLIIGGNESVMKIRDQDVANQYAEPLPVGRDLAAHWLSHPAFGKAERAILQALLAHPAGLKAEALCRATGYEFSGGFRNSLSTLRTAGVIVGKNTETLRASEELFSCRAIGVEVNERYCEATAKRLSGQLPVALPDPPGSQEPPR